MFAILAPRTFPVLIPGSPSILAISVTATSGSEVDVASIMKPTVEVARPVASEPP
jgi:hypothetical protein